MKQNIFKPAAMLILFMVMAHSCEKKDLTKLPPETQEGKNTFGCYVNEELFVAERGYSTTLGMPHLYAEYGTKVKILEIIAYGKKGKIKFNILNPKEKMINTSFMVYTNIDGLEYEGHNWFSVCDYITNKCSFVAGNINIGEIYLNKLDTVNKIASGSFYCKMGAYEKSGLKDINAYVLDSIANISKGYFDIPIYVNNNW